MVLKFTQTAALRDQIKAMSEKLAAAENDIVEMCTGLHQLRFEVGHTLVGDVQEFVNSVAQHPKEYDRTVEAYVFESRQVKKSGLDYADYVGKKIRDTQIESSTTGGLGVAAGAATVFGAPTAAMAVATTFGTASTGTAISALSGAAATKAALAWLGGGALAAGGGGMAAGNALLLLAGPVGWGVAGASVAAGLGWAAYKGSANAEEARRMLLSLEDAQSKVKVTTEEVSALYGLTALHTNELRSMLKELTVSAPRNYLEYSHQQKELLGALHNNVLALGNLLKLKPGEIADLDAPLDSHSRSETNAPHKETQSPPTDEAKCPKTWTEAVFPVASQYLKWVR